MRPEQEEKLREIQVIAQRKHPGREWKDLSESEQSAVYADHDSAKGIATDMFNTPMPQGKRVGPSELYVNASPWDSLAAATQRATGGYMLGKANRAEKEGRKSLADLQTRRDSLDRESADKRYREEERYRQHELLLHNW